MQLFDVYRMYSRELEKKGQKVDDEFAELSVHAAAYEAVKNPESSHPKADIIKNRIKFLSELAQETSLSEALIRELDPFVLYLNASFVSGELSDDNHRLIFQCLESYILRQLLCDWDSDYKKKINRVTSRVRSFFSGVIRGDIEFSVQEFVNFLSSSKYSPWPTDDDVKESLRSAGDLRPAAFMIYILYRIERWKRENECDRHVGIDANSDVALTTSLSREHIQSQSKGEDLVQSIGNLTITDEDYNSKKLSNHDFHIKHQYFAKDSSLVLNREIASHYGKNGVWKDREIQERETDLSNLICEKILPDATWFIKKTTGSLPAPRTQPLWVSRINSKPYQRIHFLFHRPAYLSKILSQINVTSTFDGTGITDERNVRLNQQDIILACSEAAWTELQSDIEFTSKKKNKKRPYVYVWDSLLKEAKEKGALVKVTTRFEQIISGHIMGYDDTVIEMQVNGHEIIVVREQGIFAFETNVWYFGEVIEWASTDEGLIRCTNNSRPIWQKIPVNSDLLDESLTKKRLYPGQDVKFNVTMSFVNNEVNLRACNVQLATIDELYPQRKFESLLNSNDYQPVKFITYPESNMEFKELSKIEVFENRVIGFNEDNEEQTLDKLNILFACSAAAWSTLDSPTPNLEKYPSVQILDVIKEEKLRPIPEPVKQFQAKEWLLESAKNKGNLVTVIMRTGHLLRGIIESFNDEAILMVVREKRVIVFNHNIYEFETEEYHQGEVTMCLDKESGFIKSRHDSAIYVKLDKSDDQLDSLYTGQKVEFKICQIHEEQYLQAFNVQPLRE